jgi:hypothetical protein
MAVPKNVQRQLDAAEATQQAIAAEAVTQDPNLVTDVRQLEQPAPTPAVAPEPTPAPAPAPQSQDSLDHKFRTLQGMWNAERAQNKALESQLSQLSQQVQVLVAAASKPAAPVQTPAPQADPRDAAQFGEDMVEMVQRYTTRALEAMRSDVAAVAADLDKRLKSLEGQIGGVSQKTEMTLEQAFYGALDQAVPEWRQINVDERWLAWLGEVDEVYGAPRQAALESAHQRMDAKRVIAIFNQFKAATPAKPKLESQQTPSGSGQPAPVPQAEPVKRMVSTKLVKQFYDDLAKGRYRGREAEADRLQAEIDRAAMEGRIV